MLREGLNSASQTRTFKERREMSKNRLALSSCKIMDLTESMYLRKEGHLQKQEQKSNSCSPQKSASPVLDEVEIN